jgi:hypothetical protein
MIDRSRGRAPTHKRGLFAVRGVGFLRHAERRALARRNSIRGRASRAI